MLSPSINSSANVATFGERHFERPSARRDAEPISATGTAQEAPRRHRVVTESHAEIIGRQVGKCGEVRDVRDASRGLTFRYASRAQRSPGSSFR